VKKGRGLADQYRNNRGRVRKLYLGGREVVCAIETPGNASAGGTYFRRPFAPEEMERKGNA